MAGSSTRPVVVGWDATLASVGALDLAADEAMARVVPLVVVSIVEPPLDPDLEQHRRLLDLAVSRAVAEHPGLSVSGDLVHGTPVEALLAHSHHACLLVVGHTHSADHSVAERVAVGAPVPVIVYRPFTARSARGRPVLVGVDEPDHTGPTVAFATIEAALRGVPLTELPPGHVLPDLVVASHHAGLVVSDTPHLRALIERAECPIGIVG